MATASHSNDIMANPQGVDRPCSTRLKSLRRILEIILHMYTCIENYRQLNKYMQTYMYMDIKNIQENKVNINVGEEPPGSSQSILR